MQATGLGGMGGMVSGNVRPPGKCRFTFDHILSRLQEQPQKSREAGAELHTLMGAMNYIHDMDLYLPISLPIPPRYLKSTPSRSSFVCVCTSARPHRAPIPASQHSVLAR